MMGKSKSTILAMSLLLSLSSVAWSDSFEQFFSSNTPGDDPEQPDTVYMVCLNQDTNRQSIQFWLKTDNIAELDSIAGIFIPLIISVDKPGVVLDTVVANTFAGSAIASWDYLAVTVGDVARSPPDSFPMKMHFGGANLGAGEYLGAGDHLIATLTFMVSEPTNLCLDTSDVIRSTGNLPLALVTKNASEYFPAWQGGCCGPIVPTLTQWGLGVFAIALLVGLIFYLRRQKKLASV